MWDVDLKIKNKKMVLAAVSPILEWWYGDELDTVGAMWGSGVQSWKENNIKKCAPL